MHIVQMIDTLQIGGAQKLQETLALGLLPGHGAAGGRAADASLASSHRLSLICLQRQQGTFFEQQLAQLGMQLHFEPAGSLFDPSRYRRIVHWLKANQAEVIQTHLTYANILGSLAGWQTGLPVIATIHNETPDPGWNNRFRSALETAAVRLGARFVVTVGQGVNLAQRERFGRVPVKVIPNAVSFAEPLPASESQALRAELTGDASRPLIVSAGRLTPQKGYEDLFQAIRQVRQRHQNVALVVAGDGILRSDLERLIATLELQQHIYLLGERHDIPRLLAASDVYVSASHWEGLPIAVLEAMAAGLPVVATCVGDLPHLIKQDVGRLVQPQDPPALAAALSDLLADPGQLERMGTAARQYAYQHHAPQNWVNRLLELYQTAQSESRTSGLSKGVL